MLAQALDSTKKRVAAGVVTGALLAGGVGLALMGGGDDPPPPTTTTTTTEATTTTVPGPTAPLTGQPGQAALLARPALRRMAGFADPHRRPLRAISLDPLGRHDDGKTHFLRVVGGPDETGRWHIRKLDGQGSHQLTAMAGATALAVVPDRIDVRAGDEVEIIPLATLDE